MEKEKIPCGPIFNIKEAVENPQVESRNMIVKAYHKVIGDFKLAGNPIKMSTYIDEKTRPEAKVKIDYKDVLVTKDGYFAFGIGRDRKNDITIRIVKDHNLIYDPIYFCLYRGFKFCSLKIIYDV